MNKVNEVSKLAKDIRKTVLKMTYEKKAGFIGSSFSCADIMAVLYGYVMKYNKDDMSDRNNDVLFVSKGHSASAWYAALSNIGVIDENRLIAEFNQSGYKLGVHPKKDAIPGVTASSGSLGQGLGLCCGYALANKIQNIPGRTYVILGDGECNEGSNWEAMMFAKRYNLDNLTLIIDRNKLQSYGHDEDVLNMDNLKEKVESFGLYTIETNGNDVKSLMDAFDEAIKSSRPSAIIADTVKGKGFSGFEDKVIWHYKWPEDEHFNAAMDEIENAGGKL